MKILQPASETKIEFICGSLKDKLWAPKTNSESQSIENTIVGLHAIRY